MKNLLICSAILLLTFSGCNEKDASYTTGFDFINNTEQEITISASTSLDYADNLREIAVIAPGSTYGTSMNIMEGFVELTDLWNFHAAKKDVVTVISNGERQIISYAKDANGIYDPDNYTITSPKERVRMYTLKIEPEVFDDAEPID